MTLTSRRSDDWADPGHNNAPVAWPKDLDSLKTTLRNYVRDTLVSFKQAGVDLAIVSLGNEIHNGDIQLLLYITSRY